MNQPWPAYEREIQYYAKANGKDSLPNDMLASCYYTTHQERLLSETLQTLDQQIGGAPLLDALRTDVYLRRERWDLALATATKVVAARPTADEAYWILIHTLIE